MRMHSVSGDFSRWLTHAHLLSSCYKSLFHSKVIRTRDPSCIFAANSKVSAVKHSVSLLENPTQPNLDNNNIPKRIKQSVEQMDVNKRQQRWDKCKRQISFDFTYSTFKYSLWVGFCHIGLTISMQRTGKNSESVNAAYAAEIWNHSVILDKKLNFFQIPEPRSLPHKNPENLPILARPLLDFKSIDWLYWLQSFPSRFKAVIVRELFKNRASNFSLMCFSFFFCIKYPHASLKILTND